MAIDKILLVENTFGMPSDIQSVLGKYISISTVANLFDAERELNSQDFSLVLLDVEFPDGNGFEFCKKLRESDKFRDLSIIFLTRRAEIENRVLGFSLGADDYIIKPIEPKEFAARIESKLKRRQKGPLPTTFLKSNFRVDLTSHRIFLNSQNRRGERELILTPIEFKLLVHFLRNEGIVVTRDELLSAVWGSSVHVSAHTIDTHISALRKKISGSGHHLKAVVKKGYCFSAVSSGTTTSVSRD